MFMWMVRSEMRLVLRYLIRRQHQHLGEHQYLNHKQNLKMNLVQRTVGEVLHSLRGFLNSSMVMQTTALLLGFLK